MRSEQRTAALDVQTLGLRASHRCNERVWCSRACKRIGSIEVNRQPLLPSLIQSTERAAIWHALESHDHNVTHAARSLGIAVRTLHYKIKKLGLRPLPIKHGPPRSTELTKANA